LIAPFSTAIQSFHEHSSSGLLSKFLLHLDHSLLQTFHVVNGLVELAVE